MKMIATAAGLIILAVATVITLPQGNGSAQEGLAIGVDADPAGNTATSLGPIDACVSVAKGETFTVDVFVSDVTDLLAWEVYFSFDGSIVNVTGNDTKLFLDSPGSDVFDASESLPSGGGLYRLAALDMGHPTSPHSGSGVLARLTLKAVGAGISPASLLTLDANNDGKPDLGTRLKDPQEKFLGDANGDEFFDGSVINAQIAVDRDCPPGTEETVTPSPTALPATPSPTPGGQETPTASPPGTTTRPSTPTASPSPRATAASPGVTSPAPTDAPSSNGNGDSGWNSPISVAAYAAAGAVAALVVGGLALIGARRRRL